MTPTPEQMAFAFAIASTRNADNPLSATYDVSSDLKSPALRMTVRLSSFVVLGMTTLLLGLSYVHSSYVSGTLTDEDMKAFAEPSPYFHEAVFADENAQTQTAGSTETASVR